MKFKRRPDSPLKKKARRGFRGYPVATVAYYGPDDQRASKVAVGIATEENGDTMMKRLFTEGDARTDPVIAAEILRLMTTHGVKSVALTDGIIGCPHEEGVDYPEGQVCPQCPFWAYRERFYGQDPLLTR